MEATEREIYRCSISQGECILTNRRLMARYTKGSRKGAVERLPIHEIRGVQQRSNFVLLGRRQHAVVLDTANGAAIGGYAGGSDFSGSGLFTKTKDEAVSLAAKIQAAMLDFA